MKKILYAAELYWIIVAAVFALMLWFAPKTNGSGFSKEDLLENLLEAPNLGESEDFKMLGYLNDDMLIQMKVDLANHKRSILTQVAEILEKYMSDNSSHDQQLEIRKMSKIVQKCSDIEDNIWLIIKIRQLHEQRMKNDILAEKPHSLQ